MPRQETEVGQKIDCGYYVFRFVGLKIGFCFGKTLKCLTANTFINTGLASGFYYKHTVTRHSRILCFSTSNNWMLYKVDCERFCSSAAIYCCSFVLLKKWLQLKRILSRQGNQVAVVQGGEYRLQNGQILRESTNQLPIQNQAKRKQINQVRLNNIFYF